MIGILTIKQLNRVLRAIERSHSRDETRNMSRTEFDALVLETAREIYPQLFDN